MRSFQARRGGLKFVRRLFLIRKDSPVNDIKENLNRILDEISVGNNRGESITLLGATKFVDIARINQAAEYGLKTIGENKAQEFRDKFALYSPDLEKHFIGSIQENKLKYLVGKADCIDSVSSITTAENISVLAQKLNVTQNIMLEVNGGDEVSKTGMSLADLKPAYNAIIGLKNIKITGITAMLPIGEEALLARVTENIRAVYDELQSGDENIKFLSIGMSGDYKIAIKHGSNMIRLGRAIFGERIYQ